ncbi:DUF7577 domain-containing protein [Halobaculum lipolyticum]|uniref:DUF7577 domain-containing protein n=1 Tax=Halobaculum lipolyticum TaxID=3032001 RepID=A0ABD5WEK0_9EURY|nr:hypothetical protein [Halobaculum sp. DT31]
MSTVHMPEVTLLAVVAGLFALQVALVVYAGVRRDDDDGDRGGVERPDGPPRGSAGVAAATGPTEPLRRDGTRDPTADVPPGTVLCLGCGAANGDAFRFCRHCVAPLPAGDDGPSPVAAIRRSAR